MLADDDIETKDDKACDFSGVSIATLKGLSPQALDGLPFGVVGLLPDGTVAVITTPKPEWLALSAILSWAHISCLKLGSV